MAFFKLVFIHLIHFISKNDNRHTNTKYAKYRQTYAINFVHRYSFKILKFCKTRIKSTITATNKIKAPAQAMINSPLSKLLKFIPMYANTPKNAVRNARSKDLKKSIFIFMISIFSIKTLYKKNLNLI